ncbi:glycosyltransferase [Fusibacter bizertensis]
MDISVIIPVYNSIASLSILVDEIDNFLSEKRMSYEIIFVNDGSVRATYDELERLKSVCEITESAKMSKIGFDAVSHEKIKIIHLVNNMGQQKALGIGLLNARGEFALTMDDDLQHNIGALDEMIEKSKQGCDLVFGIYDNYGVRGPRAWGSKVIGAFFKYRFKVLSGNRVSSFRLIQRSVYSKLAPDFSKFFYLSAELLPYSKRTGNVRIERRERVYGKSGYNLKKCLLIGAKLTFYYGIIPRRWQTDKETFYEEKIVDGRRR